MFWMMFLFAAFSGADHVSETEVFQVLLPEEVFVRPNGELYVLNFDEAQLRRYNADGELVGRIGRKGKGPGEFTYATRVEMIGERFYVQDQSDNRVSVFQLDGTFVRRFNLPGRPVDAHRTTGGWFYYGFSYDSLEGTPSTLMFSGEAFQNSRKAAPIAHTGWRNTGVAVITSEEGMAASYTAIKVMPRMAVSPGGQRLYFADAHKLEIAVYDGITGKLLHQIKDSRKLLPFDTEWADETYDEVKADFRKHHPGEKLMKLYPDYFPAIRALSFDVTGNLVVDRWRGRPDENHDPIAFDPNGKPTRPSHSWAVLRRLCGVVGQTAYVITYDDEEAGIAKVPISELETFVQKRPITDWTHQRNIFL